MAHLAPRSPSDAPAPSPAPATAPSSPPTSARAQRSHRRPVTQRMVDTVMALTIVELERHLIPAQGAGNILYVYARDREITHDVRRTLRVFDGDMLEAIDSIRTFVTEDLIDDTDRLG